MSASSKKADTDNRPLTSNNKTGKAKRTRKQGNENKVMDKEFYRLLFNNSNDAMFVSLRVDGETLPGKFIEVNDTACLRLGYTREELLQMTPLDISAPLSTIPASMEILARDRQMFHEEIHITKDGREIPVEISTRIFELNDKQFNISIARDITERRQAEEARRLQSAALDAAANAIIITDREGTIQWVNPAWSALTGYSSQEAIGQNPRILKSGFQDESYYKNLWDTILAGKVWYGELVNKRKDGSLYSEEQTITPVHDTRGEITHFIAIKQDISERKQMEEKLRDQSIHDALTGLYNRGFFEEELARLEQRREFPISIVVADIDHLKEVNDRQGHIAGDAVIRRAAQVLTAAFRKGDIVARIGGDEFAILLPNSDSVVAENALRRVRHVLLEHNAVHANTPISISFGVSIAEKPMSLLDLFKEADDRMYREKRGRSSDYNNEGL